MTCYYILSCIIYPIPRLGPRAEHNGEVLEGIWEDGQECSWKNDDSNGEKSNILQPTRNWAQAAFAPSLPSNALTD